MAASPSSDHSSHHPFVTSHAKDRWIERVCCEQDGVAPWDLRAAFGEALPVGIATHDHPHSRARLHPPTQAVFVFRRDWSHGPAVVVTVRLAAMQHLNDGHLNVCERCDLRYDAGVGPCPWCESD